MAESAGEVEFYRREKQDKIMKYGRKPREGSRDQLLPARWPNARLYIFQSR